MFQIFYKTKSRKTISLEINPEETMQQVTDKIQDKQRIGPCNLSLTYIDTRCHCGSFTLKDLFLEGILDETEITLLYQDDDDTNESKVESSEI